MTKTMQMLRSTSELVESQNIRPAKHRMSCAILGVMIATAGITLMM